MLHSSPSKCFSRSEEGGVGKDVCSSDWSSDVCSSDLVVAPEVGVWNMIGLAQGLGAQLVTEFTVSSVERTRTGYRVSAEDGRVAEGSEVIVATGGRLSELLRIAPVPRSLHAAIESIEVLQPIGRGWCGERCVQ